MRGSLFLRNFYISMFLSIAKGVFQKAADPTILLSIFLLRVTKEHRHIVYYCLFLLFSVNFIIFL